MSRNGVNNEHRAYQLGDKVCFTSQLERISSPTKGERYGELRKWVELFNERPVKGVYIGYRTVYDVSVGWDSDGVTYYNQDTTLKQHKIALVVTSPRKSPVKVPFAALKLSTT